MSSVGGQYTLVAPTLADKEHRHFRLDSAGRLIIASDSSVAHDAVDSGGPTKIGGYAKATAPTAVSADGDRVNGWFGLNGQQAVSLVDMSGNLLSGSGGAYVQGSFDHDAALGTIKPVLIGGKARNAQPTQVAQGDAVQSWITDTGSFVPAFPGVAGTDGLSNTNMAYTHLTTAVNGLLQTAGYRFNGTSWDRDVKPNGTSRIASAAASTNATSAKASAGNAHRIFGQNAKASVVYLKFYNKATAPTVGTDTPILTIPLKASDTFSFDLGGHYFSTGIAYGFTTDAADNGSTALSSGDILDFTLTYA